MTQEVNLTTESGIEICAQVKMESQGFNGIGDYEYQGQKGFDQGVEIFAAASVEIDSIIDVDGNSINESEVPKELLTSWIFDIKQIANDL
jgi:hypothetical protein